MIQFIVFSTCLLIINGQLRLENLCVGRNVTSQPVIDYCTSANGSLQSRCCLSSNSSRILAIDLTEMNLNKIPSLNENMNLITVNLIDLRLNPQLKASENEDFLGLQSLNSLFLPEQFQCPGERLVWQIINQTMSPSGVVCMHQKDLCTNSTQICIEPNSYCLPNGPNHFLCLCKNGYYGYKCLRHGQFPIGPFCGTTIALTIILSAFFYWTQRRHVKKD